MRRGLAVPAVALGILLAAVAPALAGHPLDGSLGVEGMSEKQLREFETATLGPEHAAEHAAQRAIAEEGGARAGGSEPAPAATRVDDPSDVGRWNAPFSAPITATHAVMLPTGKVMWWSYPNGFKATNTSQAWLWDPVTGTSNRVDPPLWTDPADGQEKPANIWCGGLALLADGRVLVTGGNLAYTGGTPNFRGLNKVYTFNPFNETWTEQPDMPHGRWYPSQKLLPDGRVLIMGGYDESGSTPSVQNADVEVFTPSPDMNGVGTLAQIGSRGGAGSPPMGELYPRMFVMPSGKTLIAGPDPADTWFFDSIGASSFTWSDVANLPESHLWGTTVPNAEDPNKVTVIGGKDFTDGPTLANSLIFDEAAPASGWQAGPSLNVARAHHNTVLLPDGAMATFGGGPGTRPPEGNWAADPEHHQVELFDPATSTWSLGPSQVENRAYHSTAVLLPDGRAISAGSEDWFATAGRDTAEIYEPPYLFHGSRPEIKSAPASVNWADEFGIKSWGSQISRATLVAPAAETHGSDMNQRFIELAITETHADSGVNVEAPANALLAQPGYYMLFLLDQNGAPSVARWIRLDSSAPDRATIGPDGLPTAVADAASLHEDSGARPIDVLANDGNSDGGPLSIAATGDPTHGTASITGGGSSLAYTPDPNYCGPDSFSYELNGGSGAMVTLNVACVDEGPVAVNDTLTLNRNAAATAVNVLANDLDADAGPKLIASASNPPHGTVVVAAGGGSLTYKPDRSYCGADRFTYSVNGGSSATVSVTIKRGKRRCRAKSKKKR